MTRRGANGAGRDDSARVRSACTVCRVQHGNTPARPGRCDTARREHSARHNPVPHIQYGPNRETRHNAVRSDPNGMTRRGAIGWTCWMPGTDTERLNGTTEYTRPHYGATRTLRYGAARTLRLGTTRYRTVQHGPKREIGTTQCGAIRTVRDCAAQSGKRKEEQAKVVRTPERGKEPATFPAATVRRYAHAVRSCRVRRMRKTGTCGSCGPTAPAFRVRGGLHRNPPGPAGTKDTGERFAARRAPHRGQTTETSETRKYD